jgi:hypothetical protein
MSDFKNWGKVSMETAMKLHELKISTYPRTRVDNISKYAPSRLVYVQ